jgi:hypothetical protein
LKFNSLPSKLRHSTSTSRHWIFCNPHISATFSIASFWISTTITSNVLFKSEIWVSQSRIRSVRVSQIYIFFHSFLLFMLPRSASFFIWWRIRSVAAWGCHCVGFSKIWRKEGKGLKPGSEMEISLRRKMNSRVHGLIYKGCININD